MTDLAEAPKRRRASTRTSAVPSEPVREVCPYLLAADGGWRSAVATRDHRCTATSPATPPSVTKQRDLCLLPVHLGCATYQAARELEAGSRAAEPADGGLWPETRGAVLSLEPVGGRRSALAGAPGLAGTQAFLVGLMVVAFVVLALARVTPTSLSGEPPASFAADAVGSPAAAGASGSQASAPPTSPPTASAASSPSSVPGASAAAGPSAGPSGQPASAAPGASPSAVAGTSYRVRSGDTLSSIAIRFGVTVKAIKAANGLGGASLIRPGQVLVIPN